MSQTPPNRIRSFLRHWWPIAMSVLGTALLAIAGVSPHAMFELGDDKHSWRPPLVAAGIVCWAAATLVGGRRQRRLDRLQNENAEHEQHASAGARAVLRLIFHELEALRVLAGHFSNERVSLFRCEGDCFILIGRRSAGPTYDRSAGRSSYPLAEGCLGRAWRDGSAEETGLPTAGSGASWDPAWVAAQGNWGLPEQTALALRMPSCSYVAFRIDTPQRAVGVLVFESVNTVQQGEQTGSPALLAIAALEPRAREASNRLAALLRASEFIPPAIVAQLLPGLRD
jgi:hypothetical protein